MKWPVARLRRYLQSVHGAPATLKLCHDIQMTVAKSLLAVQDAVVQDKHCFELYGYDVMVDADLTPWLIEACPCTRFSRAFHVYHFAAFAPVRARRVAASIAAHPFASSRSPAHDESMNIIKQKDSEAMLSPTTHLPAGQRVAVALRRHARRPRAQVWHAGRGADAGRRGGTVGRQPARELRRL